MAIEYMELDCCVLHGHFGPVYLLQVSKNDDEKQCFLKNNLALSDFFQYFLQGNGQVRK